MSFAEMRFAPAVLAARVCGGVSRLVLLLMLGLGAIAYLAICAQRALEIPIDSESDSQDRGKWFPNLDRSSGPFTYLEHEEHPQ